MDDFDLETKLKSVPVPARTEAYWENFPARVRAKLCPDRADWAPRNIWLPRLAWAGGGSLYAPQAIGGFDLARGGDESLRDGSLTAATRAAMPKCRRQAR